MDLSEMRARLVPFVRAQLDDATAEVTSLEPGPGHAGFSYLFDVQAARGLSRYFLRLPPPGVKLENNADVLRQVCALRALDGTGVPHASIVWSGDDPRWFGLPYFVVPRIEGDVARNAWVLDLPREVRYGMAHQAMTALAGIHRVDWQAKCAYLGEFIGFENDVTRWDRLYERAADQHLLALYPRVRQRLLDTIPQDAHIGLFHGDFQWSNLMYSPQGELLAVIDWELTGIGATLNDVGWISAFAEPTAWAHEGTEQVPRGTFADPDELAAFYEEAWGAPVKDLDWFRALALFKFGAITGFNLMLHRRGKRHDPHWENVRPSMQTNMEQALRYLGSR